MCGLDFDVCRRRGFPHPTKKHPLFCFCVEYSTVAHRRCCCVCAAAELCRIANPPNYDASRGLTFSSNAEFLTTFNVTPSSDPVQVGRIVSNGNNIDLAGDGFSVAVDIKIPSLRNPRNITLMRFVVGTANVLEIVLTPDADVIHFRLANVGTMYAFTATTRDAFLSEDVNWNRTATNDWFRITLTFSFGFSRFLASPEVHLVVSDGNLGGLDDSPPVFPNVIKRARLQLSSTDQGVLAFRQACYGSVVNGSARASCATALLLGAGFPVAGCVRAVNVSRNVITFEPPPPSPITTFGVRCTCPDGGTYAVRGSDSSCSTHQCFGGQVSTAAGSCISKSSVDLPDNWQTVVCAPEAEVNVYRNSENDPDSLAWRTSILNAGFNLGFVRPGPGSFSDHFGFNAGLCTCPNGVVYVVGDLFDGCGSLACFGGVSSRIGTACLSTTGPVSQRERSHHGVVCASLATRGPTLAPTSSAPTSLAPTAPTAVPTAVPTAAPTADPTTTAPTINPSAAPSDFPTSAPTSVSPTSAAPTGSTFGPTASPTPNVAAAGSDGGGSDSSIFVLILVVVVVLLLLAAACCYRHGVKRGESRMMPRLIDGVQPEPVIPMVTNPMHTGVGAQPTTHETYEVPVLRERPISLDEDHYVVPGERVHT